MSIDLFRVSVFQVNQNNNGIHFSTVIKNPYPFLSSIVRRQISEDFAQYIAEEIEIACGCGTDSGLILSGNENDVQKVYHCLSDSVKNNVLGIMPKGYHPELWEGAHKVGANHSN
jgi:hypothetical protein